MKSKTSRPTEGHAWRIDALQVLTFIFRHTGVTEAADIRMLLQGLVEKRGTAAVQSGDKDQSVISGFGQQCSVVLHV
jgi:hypothetical protein